MQFVRAVTYSRLILLAVFVAGCGGSSAKEPPPPPPKKPNPRAEAGGKLYAQYCKLCHGPEAKGYAADNAPSLVTPQFLESVTDAFLRASIAKGRPGTAMAGYGKAVGGPLEDDDILKIIAWVRSLHTIDPVKPDFPRHGDATRGRPVWDANCKVCHGDQQTRGEAPWLANGTFLELAPDAFIRHAIVHGRADTKMQAWEGTLTDTQIDDLVAMLRSWAPTHADPQPRDLPKVPVLDGPLVINPEGKAPDFHVKADRFVPAAEVAKALEQKRKMVIIDARAASDWNAAHIPGSISVPYYAMDELSKVPDDGTWVLTYCACPHHASGVVLDELRKRGYKNTAIIDEGILFWQQQSFPIEGAAPPKVPKPIQ